MLIAKGESEGIETLLIGLSHENMARLLKGEPIYHKKHPALPDTLLIIMAGKTEQTIKQQLESLGVVNDMTNVIRDNTIR